MDGAHRLRVGVNWPLGGIVIGSNQNKREGQVLAQLCATMTMGGAPSPQ